MAGTSIWRPKSISQTNASVFVSAGLAWSLAPPAGKLYKWLDKSSRDS